MKRNLGMQVRTIFKEGMEKIMANPSNKCNGHWGVKTFMLQALFRQQRMVFNARMLHLIAFAPC